MASKRLTSSRYRLELDLSSGSGRVATKSEVEFSAPPGVRQAEADLDVAVVRRMVLNGADLPADCHANGRIRLPDLGAANVLSVAAEVAFSADGEGLVEHLDEQGDRYVHTRLRRRRDEDGRPVAAASRLVPCFEDAEQTPFEITIVAPAGWVCVATANSSTDRRRTKPGRGASLRGPLVEAWRLWPAHGPAHRSTPAEPRAARSCTRVEH